MFCHSPQRQLCDNFQYFCQNIEIFLEKSLVYQLFLLLSGSGNMMLIRPDPVPDLNYLTLMLVPDSTLYLCTLLKKVFGFSRPQRGCHLPNSPWPGILKLFPVREVSDIRGWGRENRCPFFTVYCRLVCAYHATLAFLIPAFALQPAR